MTQPEPSFTARDLVTLSRVTAVAPSPDGTWLAVAVSRLEPDKGRYASDLWRVSALEPREPAARLTQGPSRDTTPRFRRDGSLAFLSNRRPPDADSKDDTDDDRAQVWILPAGGGEPFPLTDEPLGVASFRFAHAGDRLVVTAPVLLGVPHEEQRTRWRDRKKRGPSALHYRDMPVRFWDHWLDVPAPHLIAYDERGGGRVDRTPLADREYRESAWDVSPDGSFVVVARGSRGRDRILEHRLVVLDLDTGAERTLPGLERTTYDAILVSPDGRHAIAHRELRADDAAPDIALWLADLGGAEGRVLAPSWDCLPLPQAWTPDGKSVLATAGERGQVPVYRVEVETGEARRLTSPRAGGCHEGISAVATGHHAVGLRHRFTHPPEPFRVALDGGEPELLAELSGWTAGRAEAIASLRTLDVKAEGKLDVETFVATPTGGSSPHPLVVWIHGGPVGQWGDQWHWRWNPLVLASAGYTVAMPNPRGSTGYGKAFVAAIWGNVWGEGCFDDVMRATDAVIAEVPVDGARVAAMGGSFGGYMTNWIGGQSDRFRCLVTHASLFDLSSFYGVTDEPAWFSLHLGGSPHGDVDGFEVFSPHRFVGAWSTPTLVIHGERDYRVPVSEALALFEALRQRGTDAELLVFPDENHWILRPENVVTWYETTLSFLARHLAS